MSFQTAVLIETLAEFGAKVPWCSCSIFSTQDHVASAKAMVGIATVFVWKEETLPEYWGCTEQMMTVFCKDGCQQHVFDDGDATLLFHSGEEFEEEYTKDRKLLDPNMNCF